MSASRAWSVQLANKHHSAVTLSIARVVALSIRRVGTVPVFDPTYATPTVYIFSVLEINVAILCASIPIFWPLVTSLAANKILIVNEVEIRTERRSENIALAEQGSGTAGFTGIPDLDMDTDGRTSRMSIITGKLDEDNFTRKSPRRTRSTSRQRHGHQVSITSIRGPGRASEDSQRNLKLSHQTSNNSFSSASPPDARGPLEHSRNHSVTHYQDKYMQNWAVPDFDRGATGAGRGPTYTTTVERAEIPYDHIRALEK